MGKKRRKEKKEESGCEELGVDDDLVCGALSFAGDGRVPVSLCGLLRESYWIQEEY